MSFFSFFRWNFLFLFLNFALNRPAGKLAFIDHVVGNQPDDQMVSIAEWWVKICQPNTNWQSIFDCLICFARIIPVKIQLLHGIKISEWILAWVSKSSQFFPACEIIKSHGLWVWLQRVESGVNLGGHFTVKTERTKHFSPALLPVSFDMSTT